jgi:hypothetical protein
MQNGPPVMGARLQEEEDEESVRSIGPAFRSCHPPPLGPVLTLEHRILQKDETALRPALELDEI